MRKARYDMRKVVCKNSSCIGYSSNIAKPGYWITWTDGGSQHVGRVLGRIAEAPGTNCAGYLAVMCLSMGGTSASVRWVDPLRVRDCYDSPPRALMQWLTGTHWVASKADIGRLIAAWAYGTTCEQFIGSIDDREKPYNDPTRLDAYINQFILE